jgi:hypothetical protein
MKPLAPIGLNTHPLLVAVGGERASLKTLRVTASGALQPMADHAAYGRRCPYPAVPEG